MIFEDQVVVSLLRKHVGEHVGCLFLAEIYLLDKTSQNEQRTIGITLDNFSLRSTEKGQKILKFPS